MSDEEDLTEFDFVLFQVSRLIAKRFHRSHQPESLLRVYLEEGWIASAEVEDFLREVEVGTPSSLRESPIELQGSRVIQTFGEKACHPERSEG
jgi:hypothetical protein